MNRILKACVNTWNGLRFVMQSEEAFRQELAVLLVALPAAFLIAVEPWKRFLLIAVLLIVMIVELLNTSIEKLADHVTPRRNVRIKNVKDMGSAAVGFSIVLAGIAWLLAIGEWVAAFVM